MRRTEWFALLDTLRMGMFAKFEILIDVFKGNSFARCLLISFVCLTLLSPFAHFLGICLWAFA